MSPQKNLDLPTRSSGPVECLGLHFADDSERREYFRAELRKHLNNPEFRNHSGFPDGSIDAIVDLSDPPYYTACPNPFLEQMVSSRTAISRGVKTSVPYVGDLEADSRHPVYSFHPYHTKVPPEIIKRLIEHYTDENDVVLDAFCGSGMTGVAANELKRRAILIDLSPVATFISSINTKRHAANLVSGLLERAIDESHTKYGWMYETQQAGNILHVNYYVWSDVFTCPECVHEFPFFPHGVVHHGNKVETRKSFPCPSCGADLNVRRVERVITAEGKKRALSWVNAGSGRARVNREPTPQDIAIARKAATQSIDAWYPTDPVDPDGYSAKLAQLGDKHISDVSRFLSDRNLTIFADLWGRVSKCSDPAVRNPALACLTSIFTVVSERQGYFGGGGGMSGNLYMPIVRMEKNVFDSLKRKIKKLKEAEAAKPDLGRVFVSTQSATNLEIIPDSSIDYIYTDPPFGSNIIYSEMNLIIEGWLNVRTQPSPEAVIDEPREKGFDEYGELMRAAFQEYYRILKPGRWITVEFHNTKASIWNLIQTGLSSSGFVVAQVGKLDKGSTTILADIRPGAVVQDLIISAYKPNGGLEERFAHDGGTEESVWDFAQSHLSHVPIVDVREGALTYLPERTDRIIFDRMVAWFIRHEKLVPISSSEFFDGLRQRFPERDGMFFLDPQVHRYDQAVLRHNSRPQRELFVSDERSAIDWLSDYLRKSPSNYRDIHPEFVRQIGAGWRRHEERPELTSLLEDNFLQYDGAGPVPPQVHTYLSSNWKEFRSLDKTDPALVAKAKGRWYVPDPAKQQDVEKRREKALLKEFEVYRAHRGRKLKEVRLEVLRAGFKAAWSDRDYQTIIDVADKVTEDAWQEDEKLLTFYDMAETRLRASK